MKGTAKKLYICGKILRLNDYVEVEIVSNGHLNGGRIKGKVIELWSPDLDKHYQGRLESGWCFHNSDRILDHIQADEGCEHLEGLRLGRCPECGKQITNPEQE